jgi:hypothetical protein
MGSLKMIDSRKVMIAIPSIDGRLEVVTATGLIACSSEHLFGTIAWAIQNSHIGLARNLIAHGFIRNRGFDWLVFIDSDIGFTAKDFRLLMDYPANIDRPFVKMKQPEGTTVNEFGEALIVTAEYSRKVDTLDPARFGLGFTRIHRSVFERLEVARDSSDTPICGSFTYKGDVIVEFFPSGTGSNGGWFSEDMGFFHICRLAGIVPRVEQRTSLVHIGRKPYPYRGQTDAPQVEEIDTEKSGVRSIGTRVAE